MSQQNIIEGIDVSITCQANVGNPSSTAMYWIKVDDAGFRQNEPTLHLLDIQRTILVPINVQQKIIMEMERREEIVSL